MLRDNMTQRDRAIGEWPCGLLYLDGDGNVLSINAQLKAWLGLADDHGCFHISQMLPRAVQIYFETHLRPLLLANGVLDEVSLDFQSRDGGRFGAFVNAVAEKTDGQPTTVRMAIFRNDARRSFEQELIARRRESDVFKALVSSSPHAIVSIDNQTIIQTWNVAAVELFGYDAPSVIGQSIGCVLRSSELQAAIDEISMQETAAPVLHNEAICYHRNGHAIPVEASTALVRDDLGEVAGFVLTYTDISERKAAEAETRNLLLELNHRSKNVLSIVQVIARQTGRHHDGGDFHQVLSQRLACMISNQESLVHQEGRNADLRQIVTVQFSHLVDPDGEEVTIDGPPVLLNREASQAIGMAIFELVTNAVKYGALSQPAGRVSLRWSIDDEPRSTLKMTWQEENGPAVAPPMREGFGYQLTGTILESATNGRTQHEYTREGFCWIYSAPTDRLS